MVKRQPASPLRLRTVFISDIHLGFKGCSAELLLDFLHHVEMDTLFLVGDIVDVWSMKKSMYWPQSHNNVLRTILGKAKRGTKVIFVPGNHDEVFRDFDGAVFGNLEIHREYIHTGADGRRILVLHGDEFDSVVKCSPWLAKLGSNIYDVLDWVESCTSLVEAMNGTLRLLKWPILRMPIDVPAMAMPAGQAA